MASEKLLIVDGHNILFKSFAVPFKFYSQKGTPLHVVTTFLSQIRKVVTEIKPSHVLIVWDSQTLTEKHIANASYKANRIKDYSNFEDSPFHHLENIKKLLEILDIRNIEIDGIEADEVIATTIDKFNSLNSTNKSYILSGDSDFYQLLSDQTEIVRISKGIVNTINVKWLRDNLKVKPENYVFYKSLVGDRADNIEGINGVGAKRAVSIINKEIVFDVDRYKDIIERNLKLITLNLNLTIDIEFEDMIFNVELMETKNNELFDRCSF